MNKNPSHPGDYVWSAIIQPRGLTVTVAAELLGVSYVTLSALLNRRSDLSPLMALRIEKVFGEEMETLLYMQAVWDATKMRQSSKDLTLQKFRTEHVVFERVGKRGGERLRVISSQRRKREAKTA
jgi:addiction module HigA family antidote